MTKALIYHVLITSVWVFLSDHPTMGGLLVGVINGFLLIMLFRNALDCREYVRRVLAGLDFAWHFLVMVVQSNLRIARVAVRRDAGKIEGEFVAYDVEGLTPFETLILCQGIGLTPGTIVADVPSDGKSLVIHTFASGTAQEVRKTIDTNLKNRILAFTR